MIASSKTGDDFATRLMYFSRIYNINTVVKGEGTVEVIESSAPYKEVTFKITPKDGYALSIVKVTDKNGNVLLFTDDTFTMPSADVIIEATFVKEEKNPDTSSSAIPTIMAFSSLICVVVIVLASRRKEMLE